jgi:ABC-type phosphate transport system substrate-binding protein
MRGVIRYAATCAMVLAAGLVWPQDGLGQTAGDVAVVVSPEVPVDNLSSSELRRIVLGDREFWPGGLRVTLLMRAPVAHEREVVLSVYRMSEAEFRQHWIAKVFRAETAVGPKLVYSARDAVDRVTQSPGALAFVDASATSRDLKVVKIDGRLPGEPGYPLH